MARLDASCSSDVLARLEVRDDRGRSVAVATGAVQVEVAPGLYEIRAAAGGRGSQVLARVGPSDATTRVTVDLAAYASAAPTRRSTTFEPRAVSLLERVMGGITPNGGAGHLVLMVRSFDDGRAPAHEDFQVDGGQAHRELPFWLDGQVACAAMPHDPGVAVLRVGGRDPSAVALPIWAGWRTVAFVPVVDGRAAMDHLAIHCLPPGRAWSEMDDATELAEQLAIAITDRIPWQERAAAVDPTTPLHRLLRGDLREPAGSAPGTPSPPADGAALQVLRGSDAGNAPPLLGDDLPVLAASADALIRYEAGHPWSLGPRMAAACATRLASPVLFRWRPGYEDWIERPDPNAWHAEAQRFALQAQRPKRLHRLAANPRLGPAGQYLVAHAADRAFAHDTGPAEVVGAPIGDLVLTTGLPALALQSGMRRAVVEVHRARSRRRLRMGLAAVAVVVSVALATWQLQRSDGASGNRPITTTSEPTTVAPEDDDDPVAPESDDRTVPDLKGRLEAEARDLLAALDFTVSPTVRRADAAVEEGKVIDSTPPGGTQAKKGDPVALIVSTGPASSGGGGGGTVAVPDVTDLPEDEARARLERDGFTVSDVEPEESSTVDQGRVIRTKPPAGAQVQPGLAVALVVSAGPFEPGGSIPDVGGLSEAEATERLRAAGFEVNVEHTEADSPSDPDIGTVGDQSPPAGTKAPEGAEVTITVVDPPSEPPPPPPTPPTVGPVIR